MPLACRPNSGNQDPPPAAASWGGCCGTLRRKAAVAESSFSQKPRAKADTVARRTDSLFHESSRFNVAIPRS